MFFVTMVMNLLPDQSMKKYLRLFAGTVLILLVFRTDCADHGGGDNDGGDI